MLEKVQVKLDANSVKGIKIESVVPLESLSFGTAGSTFVCIRRNAQNSDGSINIITGSLPNTLKFVSKEIDPSTGEPDANGYEDDYQVFI